MSHFEHRVMMVLKYLLPPASSSASNFQCTHRHSLKKKNGLANVHAIYFQALFFPHFRLILEMTLNTTAYTYQMQITSLNPSTKVCVSFARSISVSLSISAQSVLVIQRANVYGLLFTHSPTRSLAHTLSIRFAHPPVIHHADGELVSKVLFRGANF